MQSQTPPRLVLIRHGPSARVASGGLLDRAGVERRRAVQDLAGIEANCQPPARLRQLVGSADAVIASDLPRAIASAQRLVGNQSVRITPLVREFPLAIPRSPFVFSPLLWEWLIHVHWGLRILRGTDASPSERARVAEAAEWLSGVAIGGGTVIVVTHGVFRRLLARRLVACGWLGAGRQGGYRPWSSWSFVYASARKEERRAPARSGV